MVTGRAGSEPVATETVPRRWHEHAKAARRVKSNLSQRHATNDAVVDVAIGRSDSKIGRLWKNTVEVDVQRGAASSLNLPDSAEGVGIEKNPIDQTDNEIELQFCHNMGDYYGVVGGIETRAVRDGDNELDATSTLCCPVKKGSTEYALVSNHMFLPGGTECDGNWGKKLYQDDIYDKIGEVKRYNESLDYALVKPYHPDVEMQNRVEGESYADGSIVGHVNKDGLQTHMSLGTDVYKMGLSTGRQRGPIKGIDKNYKKGCPNIDGEGIRTEAYCAKGDSGGPHYIPTDNGVLIAGLHVGSKQLLSEGETCTNDGNDNNNFSIKAKGMAAPAYKIVQQDSVEFSY